MTKPTIWLCAQRRLRSAWASAQSDQSSLSAWRNLGSLATHWAHSEDSDQIGRMPRLIWVVAGRTFTVLVLSCRGSIMPWMSQNVTRSHAFYGFSVCSYDCLARDGFTTTLTCILCTCGNSMDSCGCRKLNTAEKRCDLKFDCQWLSALYQKNMSSYIKFQNRKNRDIHGKNTRTWL